MREVPRDENGERGDKIRDRLVTFLGLFRNYDRPRLKFCPQHARLSPACASRGVAKQAHPTVRKTLSSLCRQSAARLLLNAFCTSV